MDFSPRFFYPFPTPLLTGGFSLLSVPYPVVLVFDFFLFSFFYVFVKDLFSARPLFLS